MGPYLRVIRLDGSFLKHNKLNGEVSLIRNGIVLVYYISVPNWYL